MPKNGHDISSREIFRSAHGSFSTPSDTSGVLDHAAVARGSGLFVHPQPGASSGSLGGSAQLGGVVATVPRPRRGVGQDKVALTRDPKASTEPASVSHARRSDHVGTSLPRSQNTRTRKRRKEPFTLHVDRLLKAEVKRQAEIEGLSASATGAALLEWALRQKLHLQQAATLETALETIITRVIGKRDARLAHLLVRNAYASEQGRILDANILSRMPGVTPEMLDEILDRSAKAAKAKITQSSPQLEEMLRELEEMLTNNEDREKKSALPELP